MNSEALSGYIVSFQILGLISLGILVKHGLDL